MVDATKERFTLVKVFGNEMLFTECRVDKETIPKDLYVYAVRHCDDDWGEPAEISEWIMVNHFGTLISKTEITEWDFYSEKLNKHSKYIEFENDPEFGEVPKEEHWTYVEWETVSLDDYINAKEA